ncbi:MAG: FkbM family methyltransferase [Euryarchaeota archaeon]|nr:FkbM family methyltransferase [Euryarchaeota archaeon]MDE1837516.1 FkbM family methyltransferase [Euryarchaeota archaeon]MDE2046497.1 FkbM family methyltransferase [Thermoplasmata archaeon]
MWAVHEFFEAPYFGVFTKKGRWRHHEELEKRAEQRFMATTRELNLSLEEDPPGSFRNYFPVLASGIYTKFEDFVPRGLVIDAGASVGDYAVLIARKYGVEVRSFEPDVQRFATLTKNVERNQLAARVSPKRAALGSSLGVTKVAIVPHHGAVKEGEAGPLSEVPLLTVDSLHVSPDILKIDVEGMEVEVLEGSRETIRLHHPKIIIETHSKELRKRVTRDLQESGYRLRHKEFGGRDGSAPWMDELYNLFFSAN